MEMRRSRQNVKNKITSFIKEILPIKFLKLLKHQNRLCGCVCGLSLIFLLVCLFICCCFCFGFGFVVCCVLCFVFVLFLLFLFFCFLFVFCFETSLEPSPTISKLQYLGTLTTFDLTLSTILTAARWTKRFVSVLFCRYTCIFVVLVCHFVCLSSCRLSVSCLPNFCLSMFSVCVCVCVG